MSCLYREVGAKDSAAASAHCPDHWGDDGNCSAAPRRLVRQLVCNRTDGGELSLSSPAPSGSDQGPPGPATGLDLDLARLGGVTLNMAQEAPADLGFRFGVNPVTGLTVNFSSVVEIIKG